MLTIYELKELCKQRKIRGYGGKNKEALLTLLGVETIPAAIALTEPVPITIVTPSIDVFELSGPFTYVFERSKHLEPIKPAHSTNFWRLFEIIDTTRPHFLVLENVKNLVRHEGGETFETLKKGLESRAYFHRYRILDTLQDNARIYTVCLKDKEEYSDNDYLYEKAEEARISIVVNPTINNKHIYNKESSAWVSKRYEKDSTIYSYTRMHISKCMADKPSAARSDSGDLSLRECFNFDEFPESGQPI